MPEGGAVEGAARGAGNVLTHKVGPLPVWAWGGVVLIVGGAAYLLLSKTPQGQQLGGQLNGLGQGLTGGLGGGGGGGNTTTTPAATLTNAQWLQKVVGDVSKTTGLSIFDVTRYLNEFLNGETPQGNANAASNAQKAIAAALAAGGQPPNAPTATSGTNPFNTVNEWLSAILGDVQANGGSGSIQTEITNWVNGQTSTISQAAYNALIAAEDLVGGAPGGLGHPGITPPGTGANNPVPTISLDTITGALQSILGTPAWGAVQATDPNKFLKRFNLIADSILGAYPNLGIDRGTLIGLIDNAFEATGDYNNPQAITSNIQAYLTRQPLPYVPTPGTPPRKTQ